MAQGPKFCPRCGTLMRPRVINGKAYLECPKCGYREELQPQSKNELSHTHRVLHTPKEKIVVVDATAPPPTAQVLKGSVRCPRCGNDEVLVWMMQTRAADEPPTRFYRCTKCGYTWREYA
ncbi:MAG: transcription factor S, archaeal [uncultured Acidilobus sp. MG]|nr:MAG: transcription factor S, archaeal [uncultured Acidilobus sp. MG]